VHRCRCFPADDEAFAAFVAVCEAGLVEGPWDQPTLLERRLRARYPEAVVRPQSDLAVTRNDRIWYVYRDGRPLA
jgi:hypothetical protein